MENPSTTERLQSRIASLRDLAEGKTSFREFGDFYEQEAFVKNLRKYIRQVNQLSSREFETNLDDLREGWEMVKGVLPLMFEFPPGIVFENNELVDEEELVEILDMTVDDSMFPEIQVDYDKRMKYYKEMRAMNLEPIKRFVDRHLGTISDGLDVDNSKIVQAYEKALDELDRFSKEDFDKVMYMVLVDLYNK